MAKNPRLEKISWIAGISSAAVAIVALYVTVIDRSDSTVVSQSTDTVVGSQIGSVTGDVTIVNSPNTQSSKENDWSDKIETFSDHISLTTSNSETGLIEFLKRNNDKFVYIDSWLDASLGWVPEQEEIAERCGVDYEALDSGKVAGVLFNIPMYKKYEQAVCGSDYIVLSPRSGTTYERSAGGTGIVQYRFKGFFELSSSYHSGPSIYYHLKEIEVPFDVRAKFGK